MSTDNTDNTDNTVKSDPRSAIARAILATMLPADRLRLIGAFGAWLRAMPVGATPRMSGGATKASVSAANEAFVSALEGGDLWIHAHALFATWFAGPNDEPDVIFATRIAKGWDEGAERVERALDDVTDALADFAPGGPSADELEAAAKRAYDADRNPF